MVMRIGVAFQNESLEFELADAQLVAAWSGPAGIGRSSAGAAIEDALESPCDYPPLRQMVVPGDRVVIAVDPTIEDCEPVVAAIIVRLEAAGIERGSVSVLLPPHGPTLLKLPPGLGLSTVVHDPSDRSQIAYLATTKQGRRIYLNRIVADADLVVPVGQLAFDPIVGHGGPWTVLFPGMSDRETIQSFRAGLREDDDERSPARSRAGLDESFEVSWLLGTPFHIGLVPGASGLIEVRAGRDTSVRQRGIEALDRHWTLRADSRAELVVIGIGRPGAATTFESLAQGLATASRLVQHGGKIIVLSRVSGEIGPSLRCLIDAGDPKRGAAALRGHESDSDFLVAWRIARALAWADLFLLSELPKDVAEDLCVTPLERPEQARRLVARAGSCSFVSRAELTRAIVREPAKP
jgi:hypothetical protein